MPGYFKAIKTATWDIGQVGADQHEPPSNRIQKGCLDHRPSVSYLVIIGVLASNLKSFKRGIDSNDIHSRFFTGQGNPNATGSGAHISHTETSWVISTDGQRGLDQELRFRPRYERCAAYSEASSEELLATQDICKRCPGLD